ncbi:hypothetical protein [Rhodospira trueperi]|uniref:CVNH domain-containing protein n=1 Tax=Rhodospira trueperi TaxID=69960 RepID=A0A1G7CTL8_9PROT|nr:hypothetical protein [Rhodospira trueperi]SDE42593.1 hypothetical protein SAMN05421720_106214 [Rhodospira trueperi]
MTLNRTAIALAAALTLAPVAARAADGAQVELRCDQDGQPVDLRTCLTESRLEISREGVKTEYRAEDLSSLGDPSQGTMTLTMPRNFSVRAMNGSDSARLSLTVSTPSGRAVHEAEAGRFQYVQFYHCGPDVEFSCREYNYMTGE